MYYEQPVKKTYYRFPSQSSIRDFDEKYYYPNQLYSSGEHVRNSSRQENMGHDRETAAKA
jgi:hypothetical protein